MNIYYGVVNIMNLKFEISWGRETNDTDNGNSVCLNYKKH